MPEVNTHLLKQLHTYLLLLTPYSSFKKLVNLDQIKSDTQGLQHLLEPVSLVLRGHSSKVLELPVYKELFCSETRLDIISTRYQETKNINSAVNDYVKQILAQGSSSSSKYSKEVFQSLILILAIALGQCFIQLNFTGPSIKDFSSKNLFFPKIESTSDSESSKQLDQDIIKALDLQGLSAYELSDDPLLLVVSLQLLEHLTNAQDWSLLSNADSLSAELINDKAEANVKAILSNSNNNDDNSATTATEITSAVALWWRSRFLQVQMSLFTEPSGTISSVTATLLDSRIIDIIVTKQSISEEIIKQIYVMYHLEAARNSIHAEIETLTIPALDKAQKLSKLELVLTGAKAKRTKYQEKAIASLIVLAKSDENLKLLPTDVSKADIEAEKNNDDNNDDDNDIDAKQLNSDLLLEVPQYESIDDDAVNEIMENDDVENGKTLKRIKLSFENYEEEGDENNESNNSISKEQRVLPIAIRAENIPVSLKDLDPNEQPRLNDLDSIQLFLRLKTIRQISPSGSHLVEEELMALVARIIANNSEHIKKEYPAINWLLFSKALWERSLIEANKAKTVERGIFQMQALVEEMNSKIQTRLFGTQSKKDEAKEQNPSLVSASAARLRYINQLPLAPRWSLDAALAEKFMSIGVMKSAVEIYERLQMIPEMAVCYASFGQEAEAERVLRARLASRPNDARTWSILGDVLQDPTLWEKAWGINKYQNAKVSLAKYYYNRKQQGSENLDLAVKHMNDALVINPLNFNNWYFYGCLGLESEQYELAAEAFTRCVALDDTHTHSWSNLGGALIHTNRIKQAFAAFNNAIKTSDTSNWRIWENYLITAGKLKDWIQVVRASKTLLELKKDESVINMKIVEALVEELMTDEYPKEEENDEGQKKLTFFQRSCLDYICNQLPKVNTRNARLWKIQSKVELWRRKPWNSLSCMEKAYRVDCNNENLISNEEAWNEAVESCLDLVAAYESLGEMPGKYGAGDLVCKDWKFKARSSIRSLMSKGKISWEDSEGWEKLVDAKEQL